MERKPELTELPGIGAVREHLLKQAGYTTVEIVASRSVEDIQKAINVNYDTARRIFERAIRLTGVEEYKKIAGAGLNDRNFEETVLKVAGVDWAKKFMYGSLNDRGCEEVALKELEEQGLIKDRHGDDWKATERGIIEHKKLMILLGMRE